MVVAKQAIPCCIRMNRQLTITRFTSLTECAYPTLGVLIPRWVCCSYTLNGERSSKDGFACTCVFVFVLLTCRCESCLLNRYGVSLEEAEDCKWSCPFCLRTCNCSLCRKKVCVCMCM